MDRLRKIRRPGSGLRLGLQFSLLFLVVVLLAMALPAAAQMPVPQLPERGKISKNPADIQDAMNPIQDVLSGPAWLMAQGVDNRLFLDRPGWNTLDRQNLSSLPGSEGNTPLLQSVGPGILVPYRDPAPAFSRDLLVTRDFSNTPLQTEPDIAVNPLDPDHLVLGLIDYNFPNNSAYVSIDGGVNWEGPRQIKYLRKDRISGGDPVVEFDSDGNVYMASISIGVKEYSVGNATGFALVSSIAVSTSKDGGFVWEEPVDSARSDVETDAVVDATGRIRGKVSLSFLDKPWMTTGPHPTIEDQMVVYVTYVKFNTIYDILYIGELPTLGAPEVQTTPMLSYSMDRGVTWSESVAVGPTVKRTYGEIDDTEGQSNAIGTKRVVQGPVPVVDSLGTLYVTWLDSTDDESMKGLAEFYMSKSDDGGETFGEPKRITRFLEPGFRPRNAYFRYWASAFPKVAMGPDDELYVAYVALPANNPLDEGDVYFIRSLDGGDRWSRPKRINTDETDAVQFFPAIDVGPDGVIHLMWGDMRDDPVQTRYHIYYSRSEDQGENWGFELEELDLKVGDTRVTDFPSNPNKGFPRGLFLGDYFSIAASETDAYLVWADTRLGEFGPTNQKIGFSRQRAIARPEIFISPDAGAAGETITVQGHGFQPDMDVYLLVGGANAASGRTDKLGRYTQQIFVPISGEGAHRVTLVDESGNFASTSFYMEFGFDNVQDIEKKLDAIDEKLQQLNGTASQAGLTPASHQVAVESVPATTALATTAVPGGSAAWPMVGGVGIGIALGLLWVSFRRRTG